MLSQNIPNDQNIDNDNSPHRISVSGRQRAFYGDTHLSLEKLLKHQFYKIDLKLQVYLFVNM